MPAPTSAVALAYLGGDGNPYTAAEAASAFAAEIKAQGRVCRQPTDPAVDWEADLVEALCRRVARNLALRAIPLGLQTAVTDGAVATVKVGADPEIRRLEAPFRKLVVG